MFFINRAEEVSLAALKRAERDRRRLIAEDQEMRRKEHEKHGSVRHLNPSLQLYQQELGSQASMGTVLLQPYYPHRSLLHPLQIKLAIEQLQVCNRYGEKFPSYNQETIPDGVLFFDWQHATGQFRCEQIYGYGLVFNTADVVWHYEDGPKMWLSHIARQLLITLIAAGKYYRLIGYQGQLVGQISLNGVEDVLINPILPNGYVPHLSSTKKCLMDKYTWELDTETMVLNDAVQLRQFFIERVNDIYIGLNLPPANEPLFDGFLKEEDLLQ